MIVRPTPDGLVLFPQSAHALLAFQLAEHWGNRRTLRPSPRAEVLAAVLLHDAGWDSRDQAPVRLPDGTVADFARWPKDSDREHLWHDSLAAARTRGRYVEYLVGHHILHLAQTYSPERHPSFVASLRERLAALARDLQGEPRYAQIFRTEQDLANREILRLVDAVALHLCLGSQGPLAFSALPTPQGPQTLQLRPSSPGAFHLHPWPFVGRTLTVWAEGTWVPHVSGPPPAFAWEKAQPRQFTWRLLRLGVAP